MKVYIDSSAIIYAFEFKESNSRRILDLIIRGEIEAYIAQKVIDDSNYSVEKYRGMIKDKDLEHLAAFNDSKLDMLIAYDRDFKEIHGYVTPREFLIKINENPVNNFEF